MAPINELGLVLTAVRNALHLTQPQLASRVRLSPSAVYRWEKQNIVPPLETRMALVRALADAPRDLVERLANAAGVSLESVGLALPPAPAAATSAAIAPATKPLVTIDPNAQTIVDDALREAAEELDVSPKMLRPALSRMLDRIAKTGVPMDAASRMVLGVPKRETPEKDAKA